MTEDPPGRRSGWWVWVPVPALMVLNIVLRIPALNQPLDRDMAAYATIGRQIARGLVPYSDVFDHKQPLVYGPYWLLDLSFPMSTTAIRISAALIAGGAAVAVYVLARRYLGAGRALIAATVLSIVGTTRFVEGADLNTEHLLVPLSALAVLVPVAYSTSTWRALPFLAGVLLGIAVLAKAVAIFLAPAALVALLASADTRGRSREETVVAYLVGSAVPVILVFLGFALLGAASELVYANLVYNRTYVSLRPAGALWEWAIFPAHVQFLVMGALAVLALARRRDPPQLFTAVTVVWLLGAVVGAQLGRNDFPHYFAPVVVPAAILLALPIEIPRSIRRVPPLVASALIALLFVLPFAGSLWRSASKSPDEIAIETYGPQAGVWSLYDDVSSVLRTRATPDDEVFVASAEPGFYWHSGLTPASRYIYDYPMAVDPDFLTSLEEDLRVPPRFVVLPYGSWPPYLGGLQSQPYEVIATFDTVTVLERQS